jgi:hypothetical protein
MLLLTHTILLRCLLQNGENGIFSLERVGVGVIQRSDDQTMQLIASSHLVARTRKYEAVTPFPSKPSGLSRYKFALVEEQVKKH